MRDPVRSALKADAKAWPLGLLLILLYWALAGSTVQSDEVYAQPVEETYFNTSPVTVPDHGFHQVSQ